MALNLAPFIRWTLRDKTAQHQLALRYSPKELVMEYRVLASLRDDMNQGWVWITKPDIKPRSIMKIKYKNTNKSIYCECLKIDDNYKVVYNKPPREYIQNEATITINEWYRKKLGGISTKTNEELEIIFADNFFGKLQANLQHPQVVVRMATHLALISVVLGIVTLIITFN